MVGFRQFFETIWPEPLDGCITLWFFPSKVSRHLPRERLSKITAEAAAELDENGDQSVYFGMGLRQRGLGKNQQGMRQHVIALPGWSLDIDFYNPKHPGAHKAENLPHGPADALKILGWDTKGTCPTPTFIIFTGNGWHLHWLFEKPLLFETNDQRKAAERLFKAFQKPFIDRAAGYGWHVDNTHTVNRVWRVPGFINRKENASGRLVEVLDFNPDARIPTPTLKGLAASTGNPADKTGAIFLIKQALDQLSDSNKNKKLIKKILAGESFAKAGSRDHAMQAACSTIAFLPQTKGVPAEIIAELLRPSLSEWAAEDGADKTTDEEVAKAADKIARSQQDRDDQEVIRDKALEGISAAMTFGSSTAKKKKDSSFIQQHAVIQYKTSFYVFDFDEGVYRGPKTREELLCVARDAWKTKTGFDLSDVGAGGKMSLKTVPVLLDLFGTVTDRVIGCMTLKKSSYNIEDRVFHAAVAPLRKLEPLRTPLIDEWLALLVGEDNLDKILDWIAAVPQLDQPCCALYLDGASGSGKNLLANGLSRLWTKAGPTPLDFVLGQFNDPITRCPFLLLDEGLSSDNRKSGTSAALRRLISSNSRLINPKGLPAYDVVGSVRLLIAANNSNVLMLGSEEMSADDLAAVIGRFLHLHARPNAARWLEAHNGGMNGSRMTTKWVEGDLIARHCLWLQENRKITPGKRFLVEGEQVDDIHRKFVMQGVTNNLVFEWLTRFVSSPTPLYQAYNREAPLAQVGNGEILINTQGIVDQWALYIPEQFRQPTTQLVGKSLQKLSQGRIRQKIKGRRIRFHRIKPDFLLSWASENQVGNEDEMVENIKAEKVFGDEETE